MGAVFVTSKRARLASLSATIPGLLLAGLILAIFIGEAWRDGLPKVSTASDCALFLSLAVSVAGLIVVLWKRWLGGGMTLLGMAVFYTVNFLQTGKFPSGWVFPLLPIIGAGQIVLHLLESRPAKGSAVTPRKKKK